MFNLFKNTEDDERERAKAAYEKVVSLTTESREARSMRLRIGLLCRAHLDKSFIDGAQMTDAHEVACAMAVARGKARPDPPTAALFQSVPSSAGPVWAYLPEVYAEEAFSLGALYQKTQISAEQAIEGMQALADRISLNELKLDQPFVALQFLREELQGESGGSSP